MEAHRTTCLPRVSVEDARAWFLGLGLSATSGVKGRAASKLYAQARPHVAKTEADALTLELHAHCMANSTEGLSSHLGTLLRNVGPLALALLINRPLFIPLPTGNMIEIDAMTCAAMWERSADKVRVLFAYGGRVDQCNSRGYYLEERLPLLPYVDHLSLYHGATGSDTKLAKRFTRDSELVRQELELLAGEREPPPDWKPPALLS